MELDWQTLVPSREPAHLKAGTEIEMAFVPGTMHRLAIYAVRTSAWTRDPFHHNGGYATTDVRYRVRDAGTTSDADIRSGVQPGIVGEYDTLEQALAAIPELTAG